ncbi:hypothetical protein [Rhizobium leguminosarum]|uniref:hypothetical protein n=1 Tax=Rhizobium leguminosarum TaxID=384 RepID=UPI003F9D202D
MLVLPLEKELADADAVPPAAVVILPSFFCDQHPPRRGVILNEMKEFDMLKTTLVATTTLLALTQFASASSDSGV